MLAHSSCLVPSSAGGSGPHLLLPAAKLHIPRPAQRPSPLFPWNQAKHPGLQQSRQNGPVRRQVFQQDADVVPETNEEWDDEDDRVVPSATKILVVGAGPIGLLTASYFARRGYNVDVYERRPHPALTTASIGPDHPIVLSSRALLAFKELGMRMSFAAPEAPTHKGVYDMAAGGRLVHAHPGHPYKAAIVTSKHRLEAEVLQEMRRLYPHRVRVMYGVELVTADFDARKAVVSREQGSQGSALQAQGGRGNGPGNMLLASAVRPAGEPAAVVEEVVPYDLLVGADGADSIVRERMVQAKVRQFHTQRPMRDQEQFAAVSGLSQHLGLHTHSSPSPSSSGTSSTNSSQSSSQGNDGCGVNGKEVGGAAASSNGDSSQSDRGSNGDSSQSDRCLPSPLQQQLPADLQGHGVGEFLYEWRKKGAPLVQLWVSEPGTLSGVVQGSHSWDAASLLHTLASAYGNTLPQAWREVIVQQAAAAAAAGRLGRYGATVQSTQFHGPRVVLVGDAAHAMTGELRQGLNCGIEGVRMLNIVVRASQDNLDKVPMTLSQVRGEDAQCMQQLEAFQRSLRGGIVFGDPLFRLASALGSLIWRSALLVLAGLRRLSPGRFPEDYVEQQVGDARQGYNEVLKLMVRFAVVPVLALLGLIAAGLKAAAAAGKIVL